MRKYFTKDEAYDFSFEGGSTSEKEPMWAHVCKWESSLITVWLMGRVWEIAMGWWALLRSKETPERHVGIKIEIQPERNCPVPAAADMMLWSRHNQVCESADLCCILGSSLSPGDHFAFFCPQCSYVWNERTALLTSLSHYENEAIQMIPNFHSRLVD